MFKRLRLFFFALLLTALASTLHAGGSVIWPYGLTQEPPEVVTIMVGGYPLAIHLGR